MKLHGIPLLTGTEIAGIAFILVLGVSFALATIVFGLSVLRQRKYARTKLPSLTAEGEVTLVKDETVSAFSLEDGDDDFSEAYATSQDADYAFRTVDEVEREEEFEEVEEISLPSLPDLPAAERKPSSYGDELDFLDVEDEPLLERREPREVIARDPSLLADDDAEGDFVPTLDRGPSTFTKLRQAEFDSPPGMERDESEGELEQAVDFPRELADDPLSSYVGKRRRNVPTQ